MAFSAFQTSGFQRNAYQIITTPVAQVSGFGWKDPYREYKEKEYQREKIAKRKAELTHVEVKIAEEEVKLPHVEVDLRPLLLEEISRLRIERDWLIRRIDEEETILVLMMRRKRLRAG